MADEKTAPARELLRQFSRQYREEVGVEYVPTWGRDLKLFRDLLGSFPVEKLGTLLDRYFATARKTYSIPFFKCDLNTLVQADVAEHEKYNKKAMINPDAERFL